MNFISSSHYFPIKNPFTNLFTQFQTALDWAIKSEKGRGLRENCPRHSEQRSLDGGFISMKPRGSYEKVFDQRVSLFPNRWIPSGRSRIDQIHMNRYAQIAARFHLDGTDFMMVPLIQTARSTIWGHDPISRKATPELISTVQPINNDQRSPSSYNSHSRAKRRCDFSPWRTIVGAPRPTETGSQIPE